MSTKQREQLNTQNNVNGDFNLDSGEQLIEREMVKGSPYWIIGDKENGYFLTFGKWQLTERQKTKLDVVLYLEDNKWDIILKTILCVIDPDSKLKG